jgi:hypothetical protein
MFLDRPKHQFSKRAVTGCCIRWLNARAAGPALKVRVDSDDAMT